PRLLRHVSLLRARLSLHSFPTRRSSDLVFLRLVQVWWSEPAVVCLHLAGPLVFERELSLLSRRVYTGPFGELGGFHHFLHTSRGPVHVLWPCVVGGCGGLSRPGR